MKRYVSTAALLFVAAPAIAETPLERFEVLADEMNTGMLQMFINDVESQGGDATALRGIDGMFPPWSPEIRTAAGCILDTYADEVGAEEVDAMLDRMTDIVPQMASMTMTQFTDDGAANAMAPEGLSLSRTIEINQECGMADLQAAASAETGFFEAMMEASATISESD